MIIKLLIKAKVDINKLDSKGNSHLINACLSNDKELI